MHKIVFYNKLIKRLYMFRALWAHHQEVEIVNTASGILTLKQVSGPVGGRPVYGTVTYRCDDTRCCLIQFRPPDDEHCVLETCRGV